MKLRPRVARCNAYVIAAVAASCVINATVALTSTHRLSPNPSSIGIGGVQGTIVATHRNDDIWAFGEDLALVFPTPIDRNSYATSIDPAPAGGIMVVRPVQANTPTQTPPHLLQIRWRKTPGTSYTITVKRAGNAIATVKVRTPLSAPTPQPPHISKRGDPYYYGSLEHSGPPPVGLKIPNSGDIDPASLQALRAAGVRFVRFGPTPQEVAAHTTGDQSRQHYSFASTDPTLRSLHEANITALYDIDAAGAPAWGSNDSKDPRPLFETPKLYAEYCRGVARHIDATLSWVRRVEIGTNEPNYASNWQNHQAVLDGMPQYDDATGYGYALYAKACYGAIKAIAPRLTVVAPGITVGSNAYSPFSFIDHLYASGCRVGTCWDILSIHSFTWVDPGYAYDQRFMDDLDGPGAGPGTLFSYRALQERALNDGETSMQPVMITEMGYSDYAGDPQGVDSKVQAYYTSEAFNAYLADRTVRGIVYADILQHETSPSLFAGIAAIVDGALKPVGRVYRTFAEF